MGLSRRTLIAAMAAALWLAACASSGGRDLPGAVRSERTQSPKAQEVVLFSMSLLDTGYRFGGKNPDAGIDCSGMVTYVYRHAAGLQITGSAADIARRGRAIPAAEVQPGDLVFFDTRGGRYTHVGIYIGDGRFIHAPSAATGRVKIARIGEPYFAKRFTEARTYLE